MVVGVKGLRAEVMAAPRADRLEYALGLLYVRAKNYIQAEQALKAAIQDDNQNASYLYAYLLTLDALNQREKAKTILSSSPLTKNDPLLSKLLIAWGE